MDGNLTEVDYIDVCEQLVTNHSLLKQSLAEEKLSRLIQRESWIIFGPTRTGKSTLLARLKSDLEPEKFSDLIKEVESKRDITVTIEGIDVQYGTRDCTTIPNIHSLDNAIFDLAGFSAPSIKRSVMIPLINKGLLSKLSGCKMIIVLDSGILNASFPTMVRKYIAEFKSLMTEQHYKLGMESCGFVFTKIDRYGPGLLELSGRKADGDLALIIKSIKDFLSDAAMELMITDEEVGSFIAFISRNFCAIDYKVMTKDDTAKILMNMLSRVRPIDARSLQFNQVVARSVLAREGRSMLTQYETEIGRMEEYINKIIEQMSAKQKIIKTNNDKYISEMSDISNSIKEFESSILRSEEEKRTLYEKKDSNEKRIIKLESLITQSREHLDEFKKNANNLTMLSIMTIRSSRRGNVDKIQADIKNPMGATSKMMHMVLEKHVYVNKMAEIESCNSVQEFLARKIPHLYHDGIKQGQLNIDVQPGDDGNQFRTELPTAHVLLCLCDIRVTQLPFLSKLTKHLDSQILTDEKELFDLKNFMKTFDNVSRELDERSNDMRMKIKMFRSELDQRREMISGNVTMFKNDLIQSNEQLGLTISGMNELIASRKFKMTEELSRVLIECNIEVTEFNAVIALRSRISKLLSNEARIRSKLTSLQIEL